MKKKCLIEQSSSLFWNCFSECKMFTFESLMKHCVLPPHTTIVFNLVSLIRKGQAPVSARHLPMSLSYQSCMKHSSFFPPMCRTKQVTLIFPNASCKWVLHFPVQAVILHFNWIKIKWSDKGLKLTRQFKKQKQNETN